MDKLIPYDNNQLQKVGNAIAVTNKLLALVEPQLIPYRKGDKWGFCTVDKKIVIDCVYEDATEFSEGLASVKLDGKYGFIDKKNKSIIPFEFDYAYPFSEGHTMVIHNKKIGYINKIGELIIACQFDGAFSFRHGLTSVQKNNKWAIINLNGDILYGYCNQYLSFEYLLDNLFEVYKEEYNEGRFDRIFLGNMTSSGVKDWKG